MELPKNIHKAVTRQNPAKGKCALQTKTFIFELEDAMDGKADESVNRFCLCHDIKSIVLDRHTSHLIYRIVYSQQMED